MTASLRVMLAGIIDYAGLFPPAQLPLDQAIRNYARYRQETDAWILGRFVIPAKRLGELNAFLDAVANDDPLHFAVLATDMPWDQPLPLDESTKRLVELEKRCLEWRHQALESIKSFCNRHRGKVMPDVFEIRLRLPSERIPDELNFIILHGPPLSQSIYIELPCELEAWKIAREYADRQIRKPHCTVGFKLRCGGAGPSDFPQPELVAAVITICRDGRFPLKFTAGLHHPIRHYDAGVQTKMHGFLNVFGAGVLAHARNLSEQQIRLIIEDEDPRSFVFTDEGFRWKDLGASVTEIETARRVAVTSFGSCSFDEPREDLRTLALLP